MPVSEPLYKKALELYETLYKSLRTVQMSDTLMPDDYNIPYQIMKALLEAVGQPSPIPHREIKMGDDAYAEHVVDLRTICYSLWMYMYQHLLDPYIYDYDFYPLKDVLDFMRYPKHGDMLMASEWNSISDYCKRMIDLILRYPTYVYPWLTFQHNYARTGRRPAKTNAIYGITDYYLYALDADGNLKWATSNFEDCGFCPPVVGKDGTIYMIFWHYVDSDYLAFIGAFDQNGTMKWECSLEEWDIFADHHYHAIGNDGTIYFAVETFNPDVYCLYAVKPDGSLKWKAMRGVSCWGVAVGSDDTVYVCTDDGLYAFYPNGSVKWSLTDVITGGAPAIGNDGTIYVGRGTEYLYAINPNGTIKWTYDNESIEILSGAPSVDSQGTIYFADYGDRLTALYPDGTLKWRQTYVFPSIGAPVPQTPAIGSDGTIYIVAGDDGVGHYALYALYPSNGEAKWSTHLGDNLFYNYDASVAIDIDDIIYIRIEGARCGYTAVYPNGSVKWSMYVSFFPRTPPVLG
jgi:outer membrane protein assembly factor BamB